MRVRRRGFVCRLGALALAAATRGAVGQTHLEAIPLVRAFSSLRPGAPAGGWEPVRITEHKTPTAYRLVDDHGTVVLHARAESAASALSYATDFDLAAAPNLEWRWKIDRLLANANNAVASREDAAARIILAFDGNTARLPLVDRAVAAVAQRMSGNPMPYATLMYVRATRGAVGTVIQGPLSARVRMIVAASGAEGVGQWEVLRRNARTDFIRAFGEEPGRLTAVAVMTDTDNTGDTAEAWYGDIRFVP
jgi:hypothetical protein